MLIGLSWIGLTPQLEQIVPRASVIVAMRFEPDAAEETLNFSDMIRILGTDDEMDFVPSPHDRHNIEAKLNIEEREFHVSESSISRISASTR